MTTRSIPAALVVASLASAAPCVAQTGADAARILRDITILADDKWEGRMTCAPGHDSAAAYVARRFQDLRLIPAGDSAKHDFFHRYTVRAQGAAHWGLPASCQSQNVAGMVRGTDPALAREVVIVGAHYDHLGHNPFNALDPEAKDAIRNGADDNASGTAGVMELARLFMARPAKRSIVFVTFSGEEQGTLGSDAFVRERVDRNRTQAMVNFDMIGRLRGDTVLILGVGSATELRAILERENGARPLHLQFNPDGTGPSDQTGFYLDTIPVLHFFTREHADYHKSTDDANRINAPGEARVLDLAERVIRSLADNPSRLTYVAQPKKVMAEGSGTRPYLGSVPDMATANTPGLRVSGVTAGSPADKAGMKANDIVVELAGKPVIDLETYAAALYARKPGDTIQVVVIRAGKRVALTVTLTTRPG